jgi:hypothetical protein
LAHGDGKTFDETTYQGNALRGIRAAQTNDVWVASFHGETQHWDGTAWTQFPPVNDQPLLRLGGSGTELWAVGGSGTILKWSGSQWTTTEPATTENVKSLWVASPDDAWAVGGNRTILHWDGTSWAAVSVSR